MAQLNLRPPEPFDFRNPDDWPRWKRRFQQFRVASGLTADDAEKQISTLLYCLGEQAEAVLSSTNASEEELKDYDAVVRKFDEFFKVRKNTIFERARFNRRNQHEGESAEHYIMALYDLAANCEYGAMEPEMIRDRLVVGIRDSALSEQLQMKADLTLESAKKTIRQREAVHEQQLELKDTGATKSVDAVKSSYRTNRRPRSDANRKFRNNPKPQMRCKRKGHFGSMCFSKGSAAHSVETDLTNTETAFLDNLSLTEANTAWMTHIKLQGKQTAFKLDTGAEVTAISSETYKALGIQHLNSPDRVLYGPSRQPLNVQGHFLANLAHKDRTTQQQVFVVEGLKNNLLGLPALKALHLAIRIDTAEIKETDVTKSDDIRQKLPKIFKGLGNLGEEFKIQLRPDATPFALFTPHNVPLPLRPKVEEELQRMEAMGVISKVTEPTPWCAGMVVVPKKSGKVHICVDLKGALT